MRLQEEAKAPMIEPVLSEGDIRASYPLMNQLRAGTSEDAYVAAVQRLQRLHGYRMALLKEGGKPRSVAGYRMSESLAWGKYLYLDDLVSERSSRSQGWGKKLLDWLKEEARRQGCSELHLDSGTQRLDAHRFYLRERMDIVFFHFKKDLRP